VSRFGLLGEHLGHSRSPEIHRRLGEEKYDLFEVAPDELEAFMREGEWDGINVTIPYKQKVIPYLDEMSDVARETGSVNTIVRRGGKLYGDNTDVYGFMEMVRHARFELKGKEVLVLGSGGASRAVQTGLKRLGADSIVISRSGENNYQTIWKFRGARYIVNATPVGMFPEAEASPLDIAEFRELEGVMDLIYNPPETRFMAQARLLGVRTENGLYMLVAQAWKSAEQFLEKEIDESVVEEIYQEMME